MIYCRYLKGVILVEVSYNPDPRTVDRFSSDFRRFITFIQYFALQNFYLRFNRKSTAVDIGVEWVQCPLKC